MSLDEFINKHNLSKEQGNILSQLLNINEEVLNTINVSILQPKYINSFSLVHFSQITCDINFQEQLLSLSDQRFELMDKLLRYLPEPANNYRTTLNSLVQGLHNKEFEQLIDNFIENYIPNLAIDFIHIILQENNYYNINSISDLENYKTKRTAINKELISNSSNTNLPHHLQKLTTLDRAKFGYISELFGLTLDQGKLLCQKYAFDIEHSREIICNENIHNLLLDLTRIIKANTIDDLKSIVNKVQPLNNTQIPFSMLETNIRQGYEKMYINAFFKPEDGTLLKTQDVDGKQISVIEPSDDFVICSHVLGAFSSEDRTLNTTSNYKESWNCKLIHSHAFCTRTISNDSLEPAKDDLVCIGFTNFGQNSLVASSPWDMTSIKTNIQFDTISGLNQHKMNAIEGSGPRFLTPNNQPNYIRGNGSETNWERCNADGSKVQPSYVVYVNNNGVDYEHDELYKQSLIVASQFNIPLVFLDRQKIMQREKAKINELLEQFVKHPSFDLAFKIINKFINNATTRGYGRDSNITKQYLETFPIDNNNGLTLRKIIKIICNTNVEMGISNQGVLDTLGMNIVAAGPSSEETYFSIVEDILSLDPNLTFNIDTYIIRHLGITCKGEKPGLSNAYYYKHFYFKDHPQEHQEYLEYLKAKEERFRKQEEQLRLEKEAEQRRLKEVEERLHSRGHEEQEPLSTPEDDGIELNLWSDMDW